jgi:hypothetical protein
MRFLWPTIRDLAVRLYEVKKTQGASGDPLLLRLVVPMTDEVPWRVDAVRAQHEFGPLRPGDKIVYGTLEARTNVEKLSRRMVGQVKEEFVNAVSGVYGLEPEVPELPSVMPQSRR